MSDRSECLVLIPRIHTDPRNPLQIASSYENATAVLSLPPKRVSIHSGHPLRARTFKAKDASFQEF